MSNVIINLQDCRFLCAAEGKNRSIEALSDMLWKAYLHAEHILLLTFAKVSVCEPKVHGLSSNRFPVLLVIALVQISEQMGYSGFQVCEPFLDQG